MTEAVLGSSFNKAISQKISHAHSSAIGAHPIRIETLQDLIIYHSQFDASHSTMIISQSLNIFL